MSSVDRQNAREQNQKSKEEGSSAKDQIDKFNKRITAAKMTLNIRKHHQDFTIHDTVKRMWTTRKQGDLMKSQRMELQYMKLCHKADEV